MNKAKVNMTPIKKSKNFLTAQDINQALGQLLEHPVVLPDGREGIVTGYTIRFSRRNKTAEIMVQVECKDAGAIVHPTVPLKDLAM